MDNDVAAAIRELAARFDEWRKGHDREHALEAMALSKADEHQKKIDKDLNNVRHRFVDRESYESYRNESRREREQAKAEYERERDRLNARINAVLAAIVLLLLAVIVDLAVRGITMS